MENSKLLGKKLSILNEISGAIVATDNFGAIANLILDLAINYTNAEKGSIMLVNERDELYILAARGLDMQFVKSYRVKVGSGIVGMVAKSRTPVLCEDIDADERFAKRKKRERYRTRSFISCPIVSRSRLLGVLNINDKKNGPFNSDELSLIQILANQAAIILEDSMLMNQLRQKTSELEDMNRKLVESDVVKTEFLTRISHELRTPLNSVNGAIYYLQNAGDMPFEERREFQAIISNETGKLISLVENLLDFLMIENEMKVVKKNIISINDILEEDIMNSRLLNTTLSRKNIHLKTDIKKGVSDIVGDRIRVVQFFINLVEGLSHYLESGDSMEVSLSENDHVSVSLKASRELPGSVIPYLFIPSQFSSSEQAKDRLKLYLASKAAEVHKWGLSAENRDGVFVISVSIPKSATEKMDTIMDVTMEKLTEFISDILDVNTCSVMLDNKLTGELTIKSARGLDEDVINRTRIRIGDSVAGWVALEGKPLFIKDIEKDPRFGRRNIANYNTKSLISLPLRVKGKVAGVININNKRSAAPFTDEDFALALALGERVSHFIETLDSGDGFDEGLRQFLSTFDTLLQAEKGYQKKYRTKMACFHELVVKVMKGLGASKEQIEEACYIARIYDIGLMVVDEGVLDKKKLSNSERCTLKAHPFNSVGLLSNFEFSEDVKKAILHHHERFDGTGYPDGLKGEGIPFIARVFSVVDAFSAMINARPYKKTYSWEEAYAEIKKDSGTAFDPGVVDVLGSVLNLS